MSGESARRTGEWEEIVSAALVGTDRRPPAGMPEGAEPAPTLLERAAVQVVRRRAGQRLIRGEPLPVAPGEERPEVPVAAADRLARILGGEHPRLLPEWLGAAAAMGRRVPPHLLPQLLDHAAKDRSIRSHVAALAGRRGRWLAGLGRQEWSYLDREPDAAAGPGDDTWRLGSQGERLGHLRDLRAADPDAARDLLAGGWAQETPDDRLSFLQTLADGLADADEPFLEAALDDRRREVRQEAADLLIRLPRSRLAARMAERGRGCLRPSGGRIEVVPPTACDTATRRDGVRATPPRGTGERSWWLQQVVARTPLSVWTDTFGVPPDVLVGLKIVDWAREVRAGWVRAAVLQRDPAWARALFEVDPLAELLGVLRPAEREALTAEFVARHPVDGQLIMVLGGASAPWGPALTRAVLLKIIEMAGTQPWNLGELARLAGERADPAQHEAAARLSADQPTVQEVAAVLRYRSDMLKELS
ncbi:DUF5691 domain-containing protein [Spongiactinospora sp. TRM90649]|uniref:DUF5691 domain-containing protein n=1 Tax=Spongiactinospora sp. TRM90649 TaxID=3031114 RepID=UPI0023F67455|nr:DUF5691 domain-containing protein [Spongiactinospora sp. TRM90649]MDF5752352.1 DUF5691 domain-containing protein [Spongiactinospora sp. TRM90649]